jgi:hypothetical protein
VDLDANNVAHIVWVVGARDSSNSAVYYLGWDLDTNQCSRDPAFSLDSCRLQVSDLTSQTRSEPAVAVDADNVPHVVWKQGTASAEIYYDNFRGGSWGTDVKVSMRWGSDWNDAENGHPVVAADDAYVYVAWDVEDPREENRCKDGIYFRRRDSIDDEPGSAAWTPGLTSEAQALSNAGSSCIAPAPDSRPVLQVSYAGATRNVFALWQRQVGEGSIGGKPVYSYTMNYRVLTGDDLATGWRPSPVPTETAVIPITVTSRFLATGYADYAGIQPSLDLIRSGSVVTSYVAWHAWSSPFDHDEPNPQGAFVTPQAESEDLVDENSPYRVLYAFATHASLPAPSQSWSKPITVPVRVYESIHCAPDLAVVSFASGPYPHFAVLKRRDVTIGNTWYKNVWYTNPDFSWDVYLPVVPRKKAG